MVRRASVAVMFTLAASWAATGQEKAKEGRPYTGAEPWVVEKQSLTDFTGKSDKIIEGYPTEQAARERADQLNKDEKEWTRWMYKAREARKDDPKPAAAAENTVKPKDGLIVRPELKRVELGPMAGGKAPSVAGKTGTGTIGTAKVTITFTGKDGKGKFVVSGDLTGEGEWEQDGVAVTMETALSKFRGVMRDKQLAGVRFTKKQGEDGKNALTEWRVTLTETPTGEAKKGSEPAASAKVTTITEDWLVGDWEGGAPAGGRYTFKRGGTGTVTTTLGTFPLTWAIDDDGTTLDLKCTAARGPWGRQMYFLKDGKLSNLEKKR